MASRLLDIEKYGFSFKEVVEAASDIIVITKAFPLDAPGPEIVYVNRAFEALTGYSAAEVLGKSPRFLQTSDTSVETRRKMRVALEQQQPVRVTVKNTSKSGRDYWLDLSILPLRNDAGEVTHFAAIERDITDQVGMVSALETLSSTDYLTGMLNRRAFDLVLNKMLLQYALDSLSRCLIMFDLDHFKAINDGYGHAVGDQVLVAVAAECRSHFRSRDVMARVGGEEFMVLVETDMRQAERLAESFREAIASMSIPIADGNSMTITLSLGVAAVLDKDALALVPDATALLKRVDDALYRAKQQGRNRVCLAN